MHCRALLALALLFLSGFQQPKDSFRLKAEELTSTVQDRFWIPKKRQYTGYLTEAGSKSKDPAFAWDMAVQLSALAAACRIDPKTYRPLYDQAFDSLRTYGCDYKGVFGYQVWPYGGGTPDRYYDDDEWIVLAQLDAYEALHDRKYLDEAKKTFQFVLSGSSADLDGGIFWHEQDRKSKNTCSNAPAMAAAARLYLATKSPGYLATAKSIHDWVQRLKDKDDLMFDGLNLDGSIGKTKWTYNTALMIRGDLALYEATRDKSYLKEAVAMGSAALAHWVDPTTGAIHDEGPFAHHLDEAFFDLAKVDRSKDWAAIAKRAIQAALQLGGKNGLYGLRWDRYETREGKVILLYQASMERALWLAAAN